jgi:hypothetical protein
MRSGRNLDTNVRPFIARDVQPCNARKARLLIVGNFTVAISAVVVTVFAIGCHGEKETPTVKAESARRESPAPQGESSRLEPRLTPSAAKPDAPPTAANVSSGKADAPPTQPTKGLAKLDEHLVQALSEPQVAHGPDARPALSRDIPIRDGDRALVEIKAAVSAELLAQVTSLGGTIDSTAETGDSLRAMMPIAALPTLAARDDVQSIAPAKLAISGGIRMQEPAPDGSR